MTSAVFTQGSTLRHILVLTTTSSVGLAALFLVDLIDVFFLSLLDQEELTAAVGFASTLLFFFTSICIGLQIAMGALISRSEGQRDRCKTYTHYNSVMLYSLLLIIAASLPVWFLLKPILQIMGASGSTLEYAISYTKILLPGSVCLALGMCGAAALRAIGDARHSMYTTLGAGMVNAILDPVFIFACGWGIEGAALASLISRAAILLIALHYLKHKHHFPSLHLQAGFQQQAQKISAIALPAMMTNLATPIANTFVLHSMAIFGDAAVTATTILNRLIPVAFAAIFSLSGAVGPIIGQNAGAGHYHRVKETLYNGAKFSFIYVLIAWFILFISSDWIVLSFSAGGACATLIHFYCHFLVGSFFFNSLLFMANASFNNLKKPMWATASNFSRALLGTIPFVYIGAELYGARGILLGEALAAVAFGTLSFGMAFWNIKQQALQHKSTD